MKHLVRQLLAGRTQVPKTVVGRSRSTNYEDPEFGLVSIRRDARARYVKLRLQNDGSVSVTLPKRATLMNVQRIVDSSRVDIRRWQAKHHENRPAFRNGDKIGHSHTLQVAYLPDENATASVRTHKLSIQLYLADGADIASRAVQNLLLPEIKKALTKEAKAYLPRHLKYLADQHGFRYEKTRFGTQKGRWGSCSSTGTISLNVSLMMLPNELIDYVLVHELCHTRQMNHSPDFWALVQSILPNYKQLRRDLKTKQPTV